MNKPICDGRIENPALRADMAGDAGQHDVVRSQYPVPGRSEEDDLRVCYHEQSHATVSRRTTGRSLGGVTAQPGEYFSGLCWGPAYVHPSKFDDTDGCTVHRASDLKLGGQRLHNVGMSDKQLTAFDPARVDESCGRNRG
jgi:hypothetical protein